MNARLDDNTITTPNAGASFTENETRSKISLPAVCDRFHRERTNINTTKRANEETGTECHTRQKTARARAHVFHLPWVYRERRQPFAEAPRMAMTRTALALNSHPSLARVLELGVRNCGAYGVEGGEYEICTGTILFFCKGERPSSFNIKFELKLGMYRLVGD